MADAAYFQPSFLGGEFSPFFQGRADDPRYEIGLNLCYNGFPVEEGAWVRRPGSAYAANSRKGRLGKLVQFAFKASTPYDIEFTNLRIRFFSGLRMVLDGNPPYVGSISADSPAEVTTLGAHGWSTGDEVEFLLSPGTFPFAGMAPLMNRQLEITVTADDKFTLSDPTTGDPVDGSTIDLGLNLLLVGRVTTFITPYADTDWPNARVIQCDSEALVLCPGCVPYRLTQTVNATDVFATFSYEPAVYHDGPYLDPPDDGTTLTPAATFGTFNVTISSPNPVNDGNGFVPSDVGRMIRFFSEPLDWDSGTSYSAGDHVKFNGAYYTAAQGSTNDQPDLDIVKWAIDTTAAKWTWGLIEGYSSPLTVSVTLNVDTVGPDGLPRADGALLYTNPMKVWRMGAWSTYSGYPTCGTYFGGRAWLGGQISNRFDATMSNQLGRFDPTGRDGTVADDCGISETLKSDSLETIYWMLPAGNGVVMGTKAGEWLIQASSLQDPITPTSIQGHRVTKFGCANVLPVQTPLSTAFVQRNNRKVIEYVPDASTGKFSGTNIAITAKHLLASGLQEIAYQSETTPIIWGRNADGSLVGCSYKRESPFGTQPASFSAWHHHALGSGRVVESVQAGTSIGGDLDSVMLLTNQTDANATDVNVRYVEMLTDIFEEDSPITRSWFVDAGICPFLTVNTGTGVTIYGYWPHIGKTLSVVLGGLDLGDYVVAADGSITVPYGSDPDGLFTADYLADLAASGADFGPLETGVQTVTVEPGLINVPATVQSYIWETETSRDYWTQVDWAQDFLFAAGGGTNHNLKIFNISGNVEIRSVAYSAINGMNLANDTFIAGRGFIFYADDESSNSSTAHTMDYNFAPLGDVGSSSSKTQASTASLTQPLNGVIAGCTDATGVRHDYVVYDDPFGAIVVAALTDNSIDYLLSLYDSDSGSDNTAKYAAICNGRQDLPVTECYVLTNTGQGSPITHSLRVCRLVIWDDAIASEYSTQWDTAVTYAVGAKIQYFGTQYLGMASANIGHQPDISPSKWLKLSPQGMSLTVIATYAHGDFGWDHFDGNSPAGVAFDATDGNLVAVYSGFISAVQHSALVKINSSTGDIMWSIPIDHDAVISSQSQINNSRLNLTTLVQSIPSKISHIYNIDTALGTVLAMTTVAGIAAGSAASDRGQWELSDDVTGYVIFNGNYSQDVDTPLPDGNTPTSFTNTWMRLTAGHGSIRTLAVGSASGVAGFNYQSQGQLLRSINPRSAGTQTGPALGMTRRVHMYATLLHHTQDIEFGTDFQHMRPASLSQASGILLPKSTLFSGVHQDTLGDDYSFNSMLCWQTNRPYPANVVSISVFQKTQERT